MKNKGMKWYNFITRWWLPLNFIYMAAGEFLLLYYLLTDSYESLQLEIIGTILKTIDLIVIGYVVYNIFNNSEKDKKYVYYFQYFQLIYHFLLQLKVDLEPSNYREDFFVLKYLLEILGWAIVFVPNIIYFRNRAIENNKVYEENDIKQHCTSCGYEIEDDWKYCKNCGEKIE